jgi:RNA polymerase sigma-70 factor, ECF subfamily
MAASGAGWRAKSWLPAASIRLSLAPCGRRVRRETYVGPWLPAPLLRNDLRTVDAPPDAAVELASDLSMALMQVPERLSPEKRAALILHDAFYCDYPEIAATLGKNVANCSPQIPDGALFTSGLKRALRTPRR